MLLGRLLQVALRRWPVVLLGLVLTGAAAAAVPSVDPPGYSVTGTALLLPPEVAADGTKTNPYLQLGGLTNAVDVFARALNDPAVHDDIVDVDGADDYEAVRDFQTAAPLLVVTAEAPTAARAREVRDEVLARAPGLLSRLQESVGVAPASRLTIETIVADSKPELVYKSLLRTMIVVIAAGLALTVLMAGAIDAWIIRRQTYRQPEADDLASVAPRERADPDEPARPEDVVTASAGSRPGPSDRL